MPNRDERYNDADDDDREFEGERPRRRPRRNRDDDFQATEMLLPTNVSAYSIIACYAGFVGMCFPIIGFFFAVPGLICGIIALKKRRKQRDYGGVTSDIRAILGVIFSTIGLLYNGAILISLLLAK